MQKGQLTQCTFCTNSYCILHPPLCGVWPFCTKGNDPHHPYLLSPLCELTFLHLTPTTYYIPTAYCIPTAYAVPTVYCLPHCIPHCVPHCVESLLGNSYTTWYFYYCVSFTFHLKLLLSMSLLRMRFVNADLSFYDSPFQVFWCSWLLSLFRDATVTV